MPAKGGRRGRKHKGTPHVVPAVPAVPALAKPAPYSTLNYSKFDKLVDSDEESEHNGIYTPAELGLGPAELGLGHPFGETEDEPECGCARVHCRERAEAAEQAVAAAAVAEKQRSSSSKSIAVHNSSKSDFDFGKALKSQSVKAKIAEGKANRAHGIEDSTLRFPVTIPREDDVAKVKGGSAKPAKKSGHSKGPKSITSDELDDVASRPTFDICIGFVREHLPPRGCSDRMVSNIVEKLTLLKQSKSSREPMVALVSIFAELRIGFDSADLIAYSRRHVNARKKESKPKDAHLPDPLGFQALMEKQGLANSSNTTYSFTSLSGNHQQHTQPGAQDAVLHATVNLAGSEASGESTPYESSSEDSDDIPPLMDIEEEFQQNCFGSFASSPGPSKNAAKQHAAAKSPARPSAAKPAATKPVAHKQSPAKPAGKAASTASKPSLARAPAKSPAVAKVSQPQHVTTVSDDEDDDGDDEDMPGLVSDNNVSDEEDDYTSDESEAPPSLISEDDSEDDTQQESFAASKHRPAAAFGKPMESTARDSGSARVPTKGNKQAPADSKVEGKQAPPAASTEGKAATSAAAAEPMFRPVSRGFLAQQTGSVEAKPGQADSTSDAVEDAIRLGLKEAASGTPFSFDKAVGGGSKASSAASSSKAGTGSKADDSVPASQQPVYPFPQDETTEEYRSGMGVGGLSDDEEDWSPTDHPDFDPAMERRRKHAADNSSRAALAADEARRRAAAADEAMKQLLEEEERDKAEAAAKAEKAKKEKQKTKKAKQKAKKKAQQDKASGKLSQAATSTSAQPSKASQADSSESEEEEERERFSLHDSRFASLVDGSDGLLAGSWGAGGAPSSGQASQPPPPLLSGDAAVASTAANSGNEEEGRGRDNTMMQFGGAYSFLSTVGRGSGPASEKSHSSQDSSSRLPSLPVLPPGESPLPHVKNGAYSQAGSSNQVPEPQHVPLGLRPGAKPGMEPTYQSLSPLGPGGSRPSPPGPSAAQMGTVPFTDPAMSLVLEDCRNVVREMEEASGAGDKGRLQEALKEAVNWLSKNGSNPDVAANSAQLRVSIEFFSDGVLSVVAAPSPECAICGQLCTLEQQTAQEICASCQRHSFCAVAVITTLVRRALHDAKAKLKEFGSRGALPQARPPALSSAAASRFAQPPSSMPAGTERAPGTTATRQALLELASEARRHPFRDGQPPPQPPFRAGQPPPPPPPRIPPGPPGAQAPAAVRTSSQPGVRPYLQPYQPPPGGVQGPQGPFRQPYPPQPPQEPYRQPYPGGLSPYRPVAGGRGVGPTAGRGPAARSLYTAPGQSSTSGFQPAPTAQEMYGAYRQRQAQPRPPAMPTSAPLPPPGPSHAASYGSDYGSLDRSSMSGSEATSPVKSMEARYEAKTKYVQPTPFGVHEQPSFDEHDDTDCVVCMDDVRSTIFVPCGHCLCCHSCAETVVQKYKHCPVCSTSVDGFCAIQQ